MAEKVKYSSNSLCISYSHQDLPVLEKLSKYLKQLEKRNVITPWYDLKITSEKDFQVTIRKHFKEDDIIVLLISIDFLSSDYCMKKELPTAMRRHNAGEALVIPIIVRTCPWQDTAFGKKILALPSPNGDPILSEPKEKHDEIYNSIYIDIKKRVEDFRRRKYETQKSAESDKESTPSFVTKSSGISIMFPINQRLRVNSSFVDALESTYESIISFNEMVNNYIKGVRVNFKRDIRKHADFDSKSSCECNYVKAFLTFLSTYICARFFKNYRVRVHFRYRDGDGQYKKLAVVNTHVADSIDFGELTEISHGKGLIYHTSESITSLVKSLNPKLKFDTKNSNHWLDYLTAVFPNYFENRCPILTMGISIADNSSQDMLFCLNRVGFEKYIENYLKSFEKETGILLLNVIKCKHI